MFGNKKSKIEQAMEMAQQQEEQNWEQAQQQVPQQEQNVPNQQQKQPQVPQFFEKIVDTENSAVLVEWGQIVESEQIKNGKNYVKVVYPELVLSIPKEKVLCVKKVVDKQKNPVKTK